MKKLIIKLVLCMLFLLIFGSLHSHTGEVNHHNSYLGAIEYNEYGSVVTQNKLKDLGFEPLDIPFLLTFLIDITDFSLPLILLYPFIRLKKLLDNLIPSYFQSRLFVRRLLKLS
ncbi:hypothetical protein [Ammoniphilus resinae]|uniref:YceK/YidQ family lipoprotein n=1 Tax=Ammoniphilus resinae TaxID=861532 RepID=A0ABS4GP51_9BACL|nr:hypothetical protein [Ammoniphilus resinae]MBP1932054.1 hypothetical protein [Ammoniphilus resinae]